MKTSQHQMPAPKFPTEKTLFGSTPNEGPGPKVPSDKTAHGHIPTPNKP